MNKRFIVTERQLAVLKQVGMPAKNILEMADEISKQEITQSLAKKDQIKFVIGEKEIKKMLRISINKKDNLFVWVQGTSLGAVVKIKTQTDSWDEKKKDEWTDITDYDAI